MLIRKSPSADNIPAASITALSTFKAPFDRYSGQKLLAHFKNRQSIELFPVHEADQVEPAFIDDVLSNRFTFNDELHDLGSKIDWRKNPSSDIEWLIFLHKGYYLVGLGNRYRETGNVEFLEKWVELIDSWIEQTEPGFIASDVTGRRVQNWIYSFYYLVTGNPHSDVSSTFLTRFLASLSEQVEFLIDHLTPARNHRTLEMYAIFLAAVWFPELRGSDRWLEFSIGALADNAATDILPDGVHCELSTFYHHIVLKNFLAVKRLAVANNISMEKRFDQAVKRALNFSLYVHKPDGNIPSLSDGDTRSFLDWMLLGAKLYADEHLIFVGSRGKSGVPPRQRSRSFTQSGYSVLRSSWARDREAYQDARYLVFDCGPLGAGNHGHFDLLNIEMAAYGRSLIVDPGRYTYDESGDTNWRAMFRSTRYHNTVTVDGKNQVDYRYNARLGKYKIHGDCPMAKLQSFVSNDGFDLLQGIARSPQYTATHERLIFFVQGEYWLVSDRLRDTNAHEYRLHYHLSPQSTNLPPVRRDRQSITIESSNLAMVLPYKGKNGIDVAVESGYVSPSYGVRNDAPIVNIGCMDKCVAFNTLLYPFKNTSPRFRVEILDAEIGHDQSPSSDAVAFSLSIESGNRRVTDYFFISHDGVPRKWRISNYHFDGTFCFLRLGRNGDPLCCFSAPGSTIEIDQQAHCKTENL